MVKKSPQECVASLLERLNVQPSKPDLFLTALTHKSYFNEHREEGVQDNERLEFLGDAVVDLAISHQLMLRFPHASEGELSKLRALIVNEEGLAKIARSIDLGDLLLLGKGEERSGGRQKASVLGDGLEAVLGALYLSGGLDAVMKVVEHHFEDALGGVADGRNGQDYKTRLQEEAQSLKKTAPRYRVVGESGPDHSKTFEVEVSIGPDIFGRASGRSKKEAEQAAAQKTLAMLLTMDEKAQTKEGSEQ